MRIGLQLISSKSHKGRAEPPPLQLLSGAGYVVGASESSTFVVMDAAARSALVTVPARMLGFPYHTRYELIEFAVFTLATRVRGLIPLHGACVAQWSARSHIDGGQRFGQIDGVVAMPVEWIRFRFRRQYVRHARTVAVYGHTQLCTRPLGLVALDRKAVMRP